MQIKRIYKLTQKELGQITSLHTTLLKESFLNIFGPEFLRLIYSQLPTQSIFLVCYQKREVIGFLVAFSDHSPIKLIVRRNVVSLAKSVIKQLFRHPSTILKIIKVLDLPKENNFPAEIQFLAVRSSHQSKGVGSKLILNLVRELRSKNVKSLFVGTKKDNINSNHFYLNRGFSYLYTSSVFGDKHNFYSLKI